MWTPSIDVGNKERQCHVPTSHDLLQALPELVFKTDARLVAGDYDRPFSDCRFHDASILRQFTAL
jgi:hypothetical protein